MKIKLLITILLASVVFVGCVPKTNYSLEAWTDGGDQLCLHVTNNGQTCVSKKELQDPSLQIQIDQLKEHLGVVEWTDYKLVDLHNPSLSPRVGGGKKVVTENTYLTSDPLKVEWVESDCDNAFPSSYCDYSNYWCDDKEEVEKSYQRCQELKELIK